jgi:hypothetical protein
MTITDLIAHIRAGTVKSIMFHDVIWHSAEDAIAANNGSVDAAIRLCRDLLPGFMWSSDGCGCVNVWRPAEAGFFDVAVFHKTLSIALMISVLTAWGDQHGKA